VEPWWLISPPCLHGRRLSDGSVTKTPGTSHLPTLRGPGKPRLSLRVEDRDRELFDRAADASRETLTQFLVAGGRERAERLLADRTRFQLSPDAWDELVAIMDREAKPNPKLAKLFSRRSAA